MRDFPGWWPGISQSAAAPERRVAGPESSGIAVPHPDAPRPGSPPGVSRSCPGTWLPRPVPLPYVRDSRTRSGSLQNQGCRHLASVTGQDVVGTASCRGIHDFHPDAPVHDGPVDPGRREFEEPSRANQDDFQIQPKQPLEVTFGDGRHSVDAPQFQGQGCYDQAFIIGLSPDRDTEAIVNGLEMADEVLGLWSFELDLHWGD